VVERDVDPGGGISSDRDWTECSEVNVHLQGRETHGSKTMWGRGTKVGQGLYILGAFSGCQREGFARKKEIYPVPNHPGVWG
jgi:hypothetical protein